MSVNNKRTLVIVAAIALPIIGLAFLSQFSSPNQHGSGKVASRPENIQKQKSFSLDEARIRSRNRLAMAQAMTPEQFQEHRKKDPSVPPTLDAWIARIKTRIAYLESITPEQWAMEQRGGALPRLKALPTLAPDPKQAAPTLPKAPQAKPAAKTSPAPATSKAKPATKTKSSPSAQTSDKKKQ